MKTFIKSILNFLVIITTCLLYGCIDAPVAPKGSVYGTVYDDDGFPENCLVSLGEFPIVGADLNGNFEIEDAIMPYDLHLTRGGIPTKWLNINSSNINVYSLSSFGFANGIPVKITFPPISPYKNKIAFIKFISEDINNQFNYWVEPHMVADSTLGTDVYVHPGKNEISGKILYLEAVYHYLTGLIVSYEKFGIKEVVLRDGFLNEINFSPDDVSHNPQEMNLNFNISLPENSESKRTFISLSFPGLHNNSELRFHAGYFTELSGNFTVPVLPNLNYTIKVTNEYMKEPTPVHITGQKWVFVNPGENASIVHEPPPHLQQPENGQTGITEVSEFSISDNSPSGVYIFRFYREESPVTAVVTDKKTLKFSDFKSRGFAFKPGKKYYWNVQKYPNYNSIDEFVSVKYTEDNRYNSVPLSETYSFTTAP